jgi:hypothetical protein
MELPTLGGNAMTRWLFDILGSCGRVEGEVPPVMPGNDSQGNEQQESNKNNYFEKDLADTPTATLTSIPSRSCLLFKNSPIRVSPGRAEVFSRDSYILKKPTGKNHLPE